MSPNAARQGGRRLLRRFLGVFLLLALIGAGVATFQLLRNGPATAQTSDGDPDSTATGTKDRKEKDDDDERDERVPVETASVERRDVPSHFSGTASLRAESAVRILANTQGQVRALHVEEGDVVKRGQVLLELDGNQQRIVLEERNADLITLRNELDRRQTMFDKNLASESDLLGTKARYEAAEARRRAAELSVALTRVRAPFAGIVTSRSIDLGEHVQPGAELFELADADPLLGSIFMPESEVGRVAVGQAVEIVSDAAKGRRFSGRIQRIAPVVDPRTGTVKVTIELDPTGEAPLVPGSFVRVLVETDRHEDALTVPARAIVEQGGERFVFRIAEDDLARRIRVETGYVHDDRIEILSGLAAGERIVTAGQGALRNESEVRIIVEPVPDATVEKNGADDPDGSVEAGEEMAQSEQGS